MGVGLGGLGKIVTVVPVFVRLLNVGRGLSIGLDGDGRPVVFGFQRAANSFSKCRLSFFLNLSLPTTGVFKD